MAAEVPIAPKHRRRWLPRLWSTPAETTAPPAAEQIEPADAASPALETHDEPVTVSAASPEAASLAELPPDVTLKLKEPAFVIEPPPAADAPPQRGVSPPPDLPLQADAPPQVEVPPASVDTSPPHPTPAEGAALTDAREPTADVAPAPKINSPHEKQRWFARFSRRKSSDDPPTDPPSPTAPDKPAERSAG
jgi:hypothetical protein